MINPAKAVEMLAANTTNRPLSKPAERALAEAMGRGEWMVTHQGIAFDVRGVLVGGQHRLAAIIEADRPVEMTVFTDVGEGTFDVLDTGKRRNAADVLAIEGEKSATMLAAMVRTVWLFENRPDLNWSGRSAGVTNHQIVQTPSTPGPPASGPCLRCASPPAKPCPPSPNSAEPKAETSRYGGRGRGRPPTPHSTDRRRPAEQPQLRQVHQARRRCGDNPVCRGSSPGAAAGSVSLRAHATPTRTFQSTCAAAPVSGTRLTGQSWSWQRRGRLGRDRSMPRGHRPSAPRRAARHVRGRQGSCRAVLLDRRCCCRR